jgi:hypothetical protein
MARHVARSRALGTDDELAGSEPASAADLLLELHRRSAPRLPAVTVRGEGTPLSELELVTGALMDGGRCQNTVVRYGPEQSVLGLAVGETVQPTADGVERLARAALDELEAQFAE